MSALRPFARPSCPSNAPSSRISSPRARARARARARSRLGWSYMGTGPRSRRPAQAEADGDVPDDAVGPVAIAHLELGRDAAPAPAAQRADATRAGHDGVLADARVMR